MAKLDFCFTYYDGDAARDMAHMNRLERGAYSDLIISQRKFGPMPIEKIKKILGADFEACWESLEAVLLKNEKGDYYIEWLQNSTNKSKKHSKKQTKNRFGKTKNNQKEPNNNQTEPLGDGDGYEDEIEDEIESFGKSENLLSQDDFEEEVFIVDTYPDFERDFWPTYDKKVDKIKAKKIWDRLKQSEKEAIMDHLPRYVKSTPDKKFRRDPETYLNRKTWENEIIETSKNESITKNGKAPAINQNAINSFIDEAFGRPSECSSYKQCERDNQVYGSPEHGYARKSDGRDGDCEVEERFEIGAPESRVGPDYDNGNEFEYHQQHELVSGHRNRDAHLRQLLEPSLGRIDFDFQKRETWQIRKDLQQAGHYRNHGLDRPIREERRARRLFREEERIFKSRSGNRDE